jgi:GntR family transcriptional regulator/MocR family aminotransferase
MEKAWATSGRDLHLALAGRRRRAGLEEALREAVRSGRLAPGERLPSSRALALDLGVARNTVASAYGQLVAEGWLTAQHGSATRVAEWAPAERSAPAERPARARTPRFDLRPGRPDLSTFPRAAWLAASRRGLNAAPAAALGYGDPCGAAELREALAAYVARVRGVRADPERIVIVSGFVQGLGLLSTVLRARGARRMAVEAYGHALHREVLAAHGFEVQLLDVDAGGARLEALQGDAVLLTPAHQFPLGVPLSAERRRAVVEWAARTGGLVIEDDYDGEFRYDRQAIGAVQALAPDHVVYAGTASKSLAPGVRLAWLVLPDGLVGEVAEAKRLADAGSSALDQLALADLIGSGAYDRHIRRSRLTYQRRRERLAAMLADAAPGARMLGVGAGLHALVELPDGRTEAETLEEAARRGVAVEALSAFAATGAADPPALVVGYATPPAHAFTGAISRLVRAVSG